MCVCVFPSLQWGSLTLDVVEIPQFDIRCSSFHEVRSPDDFSPAFAKAGVAISPDLKWSNGCVSIVGNSKHQMLLLQSNVGLGWVHLGWVGLV